MAFGRLGLLTVGLAWASLGCGGHRPRYMPQPHTVTLAAEGAAGPSSPHVIVRVDGVFTWSPSLGSGYDQRPAPLDVGTHTLTVAVVEAVPLPRFVNWTEPTVRVATQSFEVLDEEPQLTIVLATSPAGVEVRYRADADVILGEGRPPTPTTIEPEAARALGALVTEALDRGASERATCIQAAPPAAHRRGAVPRPRRREPRARRTARRNRARRGGRLQRRAPAASADHRGGRRHLPRPSRRVREPQHRVVHLVRSLGGVN